MSEEYRVTFTDEGAWLTVRVDGVPEVARLHAAAGADLLAVMNAAKRLVADHRATLGETDDNWCVTLEP